MRPANCWAMELTPPSNAEYDLILAEFNLASERVDHPRSRGGIRLVHTFRDAGITIPILIYTVMEGGPV